VVYVLSRVNASINLPIITFSPIVENISPIMAIMPSKIKNDSVLHREIVRFSVTKNGGTGVSSSILFSSVFSFCCVLWSCTSVDMIF
jgi:hypothetical protein